MAGTGLTPSSLWLERLNAGAQLDGRSRLHSQHLHHLRHRDEGQCRTVNLRLYKHLPEPLGEVVGLVDKQPNLHGIPYTVVAAAGGVVVKNG